MIRHEVDLIFPRSLRGSCNFCECVGDLWHGASCVSCDVTSSRSVGWVMLSGVMVGFRLSPNRIAVRLLGWYFVILSVLELVCAFFIGIHATRVFCACISCRELARSMNTLTHAFHEVGKNVMKITRKSKTTNKNLNNATGTRVQVFNAKALRGWMSLRGDIYNEQTCREKFNFSSYYTDHRHGLERQTWIQEVMGENGVDVVGVRCKLCTTGPMGGSSVYAGERDGKISARVFRRHSQSEQHQNSLTYLNSKPDIIVGCDDLAFRFDTVYKKTTQHLSLQRLFQAIWTAIKTSTTRRQFEANINLIKEVTPVGIPCGTSGKGLYSIGLDIYSEVLTSYVREVLDSAEIIGLAFDARAGLLDVRGRAWIGSTYVRFWVGEIESAFAAGTITLSLHILRNFQFHLSTIKTHAGSHTDAAKLSTRNPIRRNWKTFRNTLQNRNLKSPETP